MYNNNNYYFCNRCSGFTEADFTYGACIGKDVCEESMCAENEICVPDRKVCLSSTYELCAQYRCGKFYVCVCAVDTRFKKINTNKYYKHLKFVYSNIHKADICYKYVKI